MGGQALQAVFYDFMTICANYTKTMVFFCAFCHMVSSAVWWCCWHGVGCVVSLSLVWCCGSLCGSLVVFSGCGGLWSGCVSLVVSVALLVCCVWCCVSGAVSLVLSCCLVSVSSLVVWCAVFWSLVVSSLVWSSGVWSGVWYIISSALNFYAHEKSATLHDTLPLAYHTINFILELLHH